MKSFIRNLTSNFRNIDDIPAKILIFGQAGIFLAICAALLWLLHIYNGGDAVLFAKTLKNIKFFMCDTSFGIVLLWGGALFADYGLKNR